MKLFVCLAAAGLLGGMAAQAQVSPVINALPSRQFGQATLVRGSLPINPNLMEGRELNAPFGLAFDTSSNPPILYVADTGNNRILAWRNPTVLSLANKADKVIGQRDFYSSFQGGPGRPAPALTAAGMALPTSVAVDSNGNLYVFDAGNNRILRFPRPLEQQGEFAVPDLVIGQKTPTSGGSANQGLSAPTAKTLASNRSGVLHASLAFDTQGNLWATDPGNHRALRYPKANLTGSEPAADVVLGQPDFVSFAASSSGRNSGVGMNTPVGIAVDTSGAVYVSDQLQRVLYFATPNNGVAATRILGVDIAGTPQAPRPPAPTDYTLGQNKNLGGTPQCVFLLGDIPFVCDTIAHRVVRYDIPSQWPDQTAQAISPRMANVYAQDSFLTGEVNRGRAGLGPESNTLNQPYAGAIFDNQLWVADSANNRILVLSETGSLNYTNGTRVLGQSRFDAGHPNLVEGRDLFVSGGTVTTRGSAIAIDRNSSPSHIYVADSLNHRILGFRDVRTVGGDIRTLLTQEADIIIGQADKFHAIVNFPGGDPQVSNDQGLFNPNGVAVDADGNLWVADSGNSRLLRFPAPFAQPSGAVHKATIVLGQANFTFKVTDPSSFTMSAPFGVAVFNNGDVAASDNVHNRVLIFRKNGADFTNGQPARAVLGQPDFNSTAAGSGAANLNRPRGLAIDTGDRLYVADTSNNRIIVYSSTGNTPNGASGTAIPSISGVESVAVSANSGEIWAAATNSNQINRYREFNQVQSQPQPTAQLGALGPLALALDNFDNIIAIESVNRMVFYYAQLVYRTATTSASGNNIIATVTPNQYVYAARNGKGFAFETTSAIPPYPKELAGIQVLVDGIPAPITKTTPELVFFLVPNAAPTSGTAEFLVTRPATGEILAAGSFAMGPAAPGFFTLNQQGTGQVAALNQDNTVNGPSNKAALGDVIQLFLTGYGHLDNQPPDGTAEGTLVPTDVLPQINIGGVNIPPGNILYSGMNPVLPGLWQVNVRLPKTGDPGGAPVPADRVFILLTMRDRASNVGGTATLGVDQQLQVGPPANPQGNGLITTIAIR